jgi:multidrug resistance efflux pump
MMDEEKPGSTRIVSILPEGSIVRSGEIVCQLDSSTFEDELKAQLIRYAQAKAWVQQAQAIFEVNEITLREYRDGIYPQDLQLIRQYIQTCQIEKDRAERNLAWSKDMAKKGFRTQAQLTADSLAHQQTEIALSEAKGMLVRLEKFTGPKLKKSLEANLQAILSDKSSQEKSFALESERLARLQKNIKNCTLRAPGDGIVVYVNQTNGWGRVESQIEQGVTVREGQPIFQLPDPKNMRVKTRINETKVSHLERGQRVLVKVDAFSDRPMRGKVAEITAISSPVNGPFSDVRVYYANVEIEDEIENLRPGLTAEVYFETNTRSKITRVPIQAVRMIDGKTYVALHEPKSRSQQDNPWRWKRVELGLSDPDFIEVISGVKRGDRVVANARVLPAPESPPADEPANQPAVASVSLVP